MCGITKHARSGSSRARLQAFGWTPQRLVSVAKQLPDGLPFVALVLAECERNIKVGRATGRYLVIIIRSDQVETVLLADKLSARKLRVDYIIKAFA